jgi:hypothetical protein
VASANQPGRELLTSGWSYSQLVLNKGDLIQIDQSLYMVLSDVTSTGEGLATIDLFPQLRVHANGAQIILSGPKGIFRLTSNTVPVLDVSETGLFNINFEAEEAL